MTDGSVQLMLGDCLEVMRGMADCSVDSVVTDPPAGISFMGKGWDHDKGGRDAWVAWLSSVMAACLRVVKPGGHALVWALPRTSHWTATAIEDAGWEIRDVLTHHFGSGFPKSKNVGNGWGTALKPATEHWILARKPLQGTVAANVLAWGTGALNVDGCRVGTADNLNGGAYAKQGTPRDDGWGMQRAGAGEYEQPEGRWPPNLLLTHSASCNGTCSEDCPVRALDGQSGVLTSGGYPPAGVPRTHQSVYGKPSIRTGDNIGPNTGGASRFYPTFSWEPEYDVPFRYVAKASRRERNEGCAGLPEKATPKLAGADRATRPNANNDVSDRFETSPASNHHPTVKPLALMRWLCRLVTPPGGVLLDPFAGSGTTGVAAIQEGFGAILVEREAEYHAIAEARIQEAQSKARQLVMEGVA